MEVVQRLKVFLQTQPLQRIEPKFIPILLYLCNDLFVDLCAITNWRKNTNSLWQQIWICSSSKCKFACSTHQAPQRRGTKLPHTMLVIRQKLPKQSKTIARAVVKLAVRNEIFCPFAQLRIPATYFTLKQLIKGRRPFGLLIFWFLREAEGGTGRGLCSPES